MVGLGRGSQNRSDESGEHSAYSKTCVNSTPRSSHYSIKSLEYTPTLLTMKELSLIQKNRRTKILLSDTDWEEEIRVSELNRMQMEK